MTNGLKLKVDFATGSFDAEGDPAQLERLYQDFSDRVAQLRLRAAPMEQDDPEVANAQSIEEAVRIRKRKRSPARPARESTDQRVVDYTPVRLKDLNLAKLDAFYQRWVTKNHPERILLFAYFLQEELQIAPCSADHIFTCYLQVKEKIPKAFVQAFRDASGNKYGFIDFNSVTDIAVTIHGRNQVEHGGIQKTSTKAA